MLCLPPANEVCGKVMILHLSVILFGGSFCPIACWVTHPLEVDTPLPRPESDIPPRQTLPGTRGRQPSGQTPLSRQPPWADTQPPDTTGYGQQLGGTHPTGMHFYFGKYYYLSNRIITHLLSPTAVADPGFLGGGRSMNFKFPL